jgi:hypothetical protein
LSLGIGGVLSIGKDARVETANFGMVSSCSGALGRGVE